VNDFLDTHPARTLPLKAVTGGLTPSAGTHGLGVGKWLNLALPELHSGIGGVGVHLYANGADTDNQSRNSIVDEWDTVGQALSDNGFGDVPRWITEIGFAAPATSEETQEHRLMDIYSRFANVARVKAFIIHRLIDGSGNTADPSGNFGLLQDVSTKRSGYCRLTNSLGGSSSLC
jgi:hypothetical protein